MMLGVCLAHGLGLVVFSGAGLLILLVVQHEMLHATRLHAGGSVFQPHSGLAATKVV